MKTLENLTKAVIGENIAKKVLCFLFKSPLKKGSDKIVEILRCYND